LKEQRTSTGSAISGKWFGSPVLVLLVFGILAIIPGYILLDAYTKNAGFLKLIYFDNLEGRLRMPAVGTLPSEVIYASGYDGQFYAQIALCPSLQCPDLAPALDNPAYRARRIGLPALAWLSGMGQPGAVLQAYALGNAVFWMLLVGLLWQHTGFKRWRDFLLATSLLLGTGTLTSFARALPDLPSAVLSMAACIAGGYWLWPLMLMAGGSLIKETTVFSFGAVLPSLKNPGDFVRGPLIGRLIILLIPLGLWMYYLNIRFAVESGTGFNNFDLRGMTYLQAMGSACSRLFGPDPFYAPNLVHFPSLFALSTQSLYLLVKPKWQDPYWRLGAGFAVLLFLLGHAVLEDPYAYCRVLLPLTFAFNLLIHKFENGRFYGIWFVAGNAGLSLLALRYTGFITGWWTV
jgi:hypothetical protein